MSWSESRSRPWRKRVCPCGTRPMFGVTPLTLNSVTDQNRSRDEIVADLKRARDEARATNTRARAKFLAELGLTSAEAALIHALGCGAIPPDLLPGTAAREHGPGVTEEECKVALSGCLGKAWLQVIDNAAQTRIRDDLCSGGVLGPIYGGLPEVGCVDFTDVGLDFWHRLTKRSSGDRLSSFIDVVHEKTAHFFRTPAAAAAAIDKWRAQDDVFNIAGPIPTGPWRAQWWRRFPSGYRIDIEQRRRWQGHCGGENELCDLDLTVLNTDLGQLRRTLDRHNVSLLEWLMMASMERPGAEIRQPDFAGWSRNPEAPSWGRPFRKNNASKGWRLVCIMDG